MSGVRDLVYNVAKAELKHGEHAKEIGNIGQTRVCVRRACGMAIEHWLEFHPHKNWGASAITMLTKLQDCLLYTSPSPRDRTRSRMPSSA